VTGHSLGVGDVFVIPIDDNRVGVGQAVAMYGEDSYYLAIFEPTIDRDLGELDSAIDGPILFLALTFDAKVWAGDWPVVGTRPVRPDMPLPAYKQMVGVPDRFDVVDYSGQRRRPARGTEAVWLSNRFSVAPIRLERALRAVHGVEPWDDAYAELRPSQIATTERLFGHQG
jgi:hypothetical protein